MENERKLNVMQGIMIYLAVIIAGVAIFTLCSGCEKTTDTIIAEAHSDIGESLIATKTRTEEAYAEGSITVATYNQIRANWLRAKELYVNLTPLAIGYIENDGNYDTEEIFESLGQVEIIVNDIQNWLEGRQNDTNNINFEID